MCLTIETLILLQDYMRFKGKIPDSDIWPNLCGLDSDNDGKSNGEELGDPFCTWTIGQEVSEAILYHPGTM